MNRHLLKPLVLAYSVHFSGHKIQNLECCKLCTSVHDYSEGKQTFEHHNTKSFLEQDVVTGMK